MKWPASHWSVAAPRSYCHGNGSHWEMVMIHGLEFSQASICTKSTITRHIYTELQLRGTQDRIRRSVTGLYW